eukprot:403350081
MMMYFSWLPIKNPLINNTQNLMMGRPPLPQQLQHQNQQQNQLQPLYGTQQILNNSMSSPSPMAIMQNHQQLRPNSSQNFTNMGLNHNLSLATPLTLNINNNNNNELGNIQIPNTQLLNPTNYPLVQNTSQINYSPNAHHLMSLEGDDQSTRCMVHRHKELEFYCRTCNQMVCSNCMFYEHNGHALSQLEEINGLLVHNISDLSKQMQKSRSLVNVNKSQLEKLLQQVQFLEEQQFENIEKGFQAILNRLNEKKQTMMAEMSMKYTAEKRKFSQQLKDVLRNNEYLKDIEEAYQQLLKYIEDSNPIKVLQRLNDINEFITASVLKIDELLRTENKYDFKMDQTLTPMTLNVHRAMEAIGKFHMNHPLQQDSSFLKIRRDLGSLKNSGGSNSIQTRLINTKMNNIDQSQQQQQQNYSQQQIQSQLGNEMGFEEGRIYSTMQVDSATQNNQNMMNYGSNNSFQMQQQSFNNNSIPLESQMSLNNQEQMQNQYMQTFKMNNSTGQINNSSGDSHNFQTNQHNFTQQIKNFSPSPILGNNTPKNQQQFNLQQQKQQQLSNSTHVSNGSTGSPSVNNRLAYGLSNGAPSIQENNPSVIQNTNNRNIAPMNMAPKRTQFPDLIIKKNSVSRPGLQNQYTIS